MSFVKDTIGVATTVGGVGGAFALAATTTLNPIIPVGVAAMSCVIGDNIRGPSPAAPVVE